MIVMLSAGGTHLNLYDSFGLIHHCQINTHMHITYISPDLFIKGSAETYYFGKLLCNQTFFRLKRVVIDLFV
jgi:hypothetical protein